MNIKITIEDKDLDPDTLRSVCSKEVDRFDAYLKKYGGDYVDGLARFERLAIEGFLYQAIRGHLDSPSESTQVSAAV